MKKILFVGQTGSGKTTLCQRLHSQQLRYQKTQAVDYFRDAIDTPGEYLENRRFYHALITSAADAEVIGLVADPTGTDSRIPPAFAGVFDKPVIGIVTKTGQADAGQIRKAKKTLKDAGARPIFLVDTVEEQGLGALLNWLEEESGERRRDERSLAERGN